jgi:hypothetical protein
MGLENVVMWPEVDKTKPTKLKRIKMKAGKDFLMTVSKNRPLITFKDMADKNSHYTMLIRAIDKRTLEMDLHKKDEAVKKDKYDSIAKIRFQFKEGIEAYNDQIGEEMQKAVQSVISPLTEEELNSLAHYFPYTKMYNTKNVLVNSESMQASTLATLQANSAYRAGMGELNGNKVVIFLKDSKYHKLDFMALLAKTADIFDKIVDLTLIVNGEEKKLTWREFVDTALAQKKLSE